MRKLLIGPVLTGVGYAAGSYYGADAEQLVRKSPDVVQAAVEQAVTDRAGTMQLDNGRAVPYETKVDEPAAGQLVIHVLMDGKQSAQADVSLTPQNDGQSTLIAFKVHADRSVLREELAGTSKEKLAYAPDWMLNLTMHPVLQKLAEQIEKGDALGDPMQGFQSEADWESSLPPEKQKQVQDWRQYEASKPMVDPNADAQRYMNSADSGQQP